MKETTKEYIQIFEKVTGVKPKSGSLGVGSMVGTINLTVPYTEETSYFTANKNYYQKQERNFKGIEIKYLGNTFDEDLEWHKRKGYEFIIELSEFKKYTTS